jgi:hypothetical protein
MSNRPIDSEQSICGHWTRNVFGSRKPGHQLRSSSCKAYNWLLLTLFFNSNDILIIEILNLKQNSCI